MAVRGGASGRRPAAKLPAGKLLSGKLPSGNIGVMAAASSAGRRCGARLVRCANCGRSIAKPLRATGCPKCPGAASYPDTCRVRLNATATRCRIHLGSTSQDRAAAARRAAEAQARAAMERVAEQDALRRRALAPFSAKLRALDEAEALGDREAALELALALARELRRASEECYKRAQSLGMRRRRPPGR